ncbi:MAG: glycosyltransferase [Legionellales bacterium]|nr:glycosyltransferase [Legionellales bacterium]
MRQPLSVIIIAKNEALQIRQCLESVRWADEIVVLDSGSTDGTVAICQEYTDHVYQTDWPGFGEQKKRALAKATKPWVLSLDADEYLSDSLTHAIQTILQTNSSHAGFEITRKHLFYQKLIHHANGKKALLRLFKRESATIEPVSVHESFTVTGTVGHLADPIIHQSFSDLSDMLTKLNRYSSLTAQQKIQRGQHYNIAQSLLHAGWQFFKEYIINRGFLDGGRGFLLAWAYAHASFYRCVKTTYCDQA